MPFEKGNKYGKGGKRENQTGRPTNKSREIKREAERIARQYIEEHVEEIMGSYCGFIKADPATARHAVDKLLPAAKQILELTGKDGGPIEHKTTDFDAEGYKTALTEFLTELTGKHAGTNGRANGTIPNNGYVPAAHNGNGTR